MGLPQKLLKSTLTHKGEDKIELVIPQPQPAVFSAVVNLKQELSLNNDSKWQHLIFASMRN